ncbi:hypothetical protein PGT21_014062 [Puccinia graminis f. sp. tritici]|uniref:Uncharacterized protein n=1 Tax=Puccinia graminis f. sp. tritici TaxID=56615 RepID=A0A5B0QIF9_PUCGR|nr:hypothetical protein PGT21_014062 [Puccinia graminis f. sp. tritici]
MPVLCQLAKKASLRAFLQQIIVNRQLADRACPRSGLSAQQRLEKMPYGRAVTVPALGENFPRSAGKGQPPERTPPRHRHQPPHRNPTQSRFTRFCFLKMIHHKLFRRISSSYTSCN